MNGEQVRNFDSICSRVSFIDNGIRETEIGNALKGFKTDNFGLCH